MGVRGTLCHDIFCPVPFPASPSDLHRHTSAKEPPEMEPPPPPKLGTRTPPPKTGKKIHKMLGVKFPGPFLARDLLHERRLTAENRSSIPFSMEILTAPLQIGPHNVGFSAQFPAKKRAGEFNT